MRLDSGSFLVRREDASAVRAAEAAVRSRASRWLPLAAGLTVVAVTLGLWLGLLAQERAQMAGTVALQLESVKNEIALRMESRILALARMARRWELRGQPSRAEWESDADLYARHYAGYFAIAWVDPSLRARWQVRPPAARGSAAAWPWPAQARAAMQAARDRHRTVLTPTFKLATGERVFLANIPIFTPQGFGGLIVGVFQVQPLLDKLLPEHIAPGYGIRLAEGDQLIYQRGSPAAAERTGWSQETDIVLENLKWRARVWPQARALTAMRSPPSPAAVLAGGLSLAVLLALAVHRAQAREAENVNRALTAQISERREAQEWLRKLSRAVEQSPTMVCITDVHGAIEYVNPKFTQVTGYSLEEVLGTNPRILQSGETPPEIYLRLWATIASGDEWRGELHNKKKNGELYWEHIAISPVRDEKGDVTHFLAEMEDITGRKRLEQEVAESNREIVKTQALAAMGQAASMIAHDLRNPLSTVKMSLQMLGKRSDQCMSETERELNRIALDQVRYMEEVLADLLTYSRPDALAPEWLNIDKLLNAAVLLAQKEIEEHKVQVEVHYQPGLPTLHGDAHKLHQAFSNLIMNAAQATAGIEGKTPKVTIYTRLRLTREVPEIVVEINDNGCGIAPELLERVFEPFFTTRAKGTGLGLSIAKRIIDQHRGSLQMQTEPHGGTRAVVVLPCGPVPRGP